jgi:hypothetical protein
MTLEQKIDTAVIPSHYLPAIEGEDITIRIPSFVAINIDSITKIQDNEVTVRIYTEALVISLWKSINNVHITIF